MKGYGFNRAFRALEVDESGLVRFAKNQNEAIYTEYLRNFEGLPFTYFSYPEDVVLKARINDCVGKLVKKEEFAAILADSTIYCVMVQGTHVNSSNGLIACSEGIIYTAFPNGFISKDSISEIVINKKDICIKNKNGGVLYIPILMDKKYRPFARKVVDMFTALYVSPPILTQTAQSEPQSEQAETPEPQEDDSVMYRMMSSRGIYFGLISGIIRTTAYLKSDRAEFIITPDKKNTVPIAPYEHIAKIETKITLSWYYTVLALLAIITVVLVPLFIWMAINYKVKIYMDDGRCANVYSMKKKLAYQFANDLNMRVAKKRGVSVYQN